MDEQTQLEFIKWLQTNLQIEDEDVFKEELNKLGTEGIKKAFQEFSKAKEQSQSKPMYAEGGKLEYLKCLREFKKGGKIGCGCNGKKMKKDGEILRTKIKKA